MKRLLFATCLAGACAPASRSSVPPLESFGDDRVAEALGRDPAKAPRTYAEFESLIGACATTNTFVIEEQGTRFAEKTFSLSRIAPRIITTGCGEGARAYELFAVMPTDPARDALDPLARTPVEVMALDRTTGMYSFYVFDDQGVQRVVRDASDVVSTVVSPRSGAPRREVGGRRCYACHVQGGPIMASLGTPWTAWVSPRNPATIGSYEGETAALAKKAGRADALEPIVRNALRAMVLGLPGVSRSGLGARTLAGLEPGGLAGLLRSVFCQTELQFASASDGLVPLALLLDPANASGAGLTPPPSSDGWPSLVPVRADVDQRIEELLIARGILSVDTVFVIRLLDDRNDVFSDARCKALPLDGLPTDPARVDAHVRAALRPIVETLPEPRRAWARALLGDGDPNATRDAFLASLRARLASDTAELSTRRDRFEAMLLARRKAARAMFPTDEHPLPIASLP